MTIIKWNNKMPTLFDELNSWVDNFSIDSPINFYNKSYSWAPQFEVREIDDSYQIFAELPGMNKKDVTIGTAMVFLLATIAAIFFLLLDQIYRVLLDIILNINF